MSPSAEGKVCPNHPSMEAISRCTTCFKPLCELCIKDIGGEHFCSEACAESHAETDRSVREFEAREAAAKRRRRIKRLILLLIVVILLVGAMIFYRENPETVRQWLGMADQATEELQNQTGNE